MKKRVLSLALLLSAGAHIAFAQDGRTVRGTIKDEKGKPLVVEVRASDGSSVYTEADGTFEMELPAGASNELKIIVDDVEQGTTTVSADGTVVYTVTSVQVGNEVFVTGYRNIAKEKSVGAADMISSQHIERMPVADITKAIEGAAPGIQVTSGTGMPGTGSSVQIRGNGSLNGSSEPLYVVDGAVFSGDITSINPLDVDNITVLKDASATSLYGSRGANGVIVITTKRGKRGEAQITVDARTGIVQRGLPNYKVMTSQSDYYEMLWRAYVRNLNTLGYSMEDAAEEASGLYENGIIEKLGGYNSYNVPNNQVVGTDGKINPNATAKYADNWDDAISRTGVRNEVNLNISGAVGETDKLTDYYFSLGYLKEDGFIKFSDFERFSGRMNINTQVKSYLKVGLNLSGTYSEQNNNTPSGTSSGNPMFISRDFAPIIPVYYYDANGQKEIDPLTGEYKYDWGAKSSSNENIRNSSIGDRPGLSNANILGAMSLNKTLTQAMSVKAVPYVQIDFNKKINFVTMANYSYYGQSYINHNNKWYGQFALNGGYNTRRSYNINEITLRQQLNYRDSKDDHSWGAFAVHENQKVNNSELLASANTIPIPGNSNITGALPVGSSSVDNTFRMESYLVGADYSFANTYFVEGSVRWDGVSRFSPTARWNKVPFWSLGGGWDMTKAEFFQDIKDVMNKAKLKVSYGTQGNQAIGSWYVWQTLYNTSFPNGSSPGALIDGIGNEDLTWEFQAQFNAGLEFGFWNNRLFGEVNFFNKAKSDMLYMVPTAPSMGIQERPMNVADMYNRGVELTLGGRIVNNEDFTWTATLQATHYKNMITKMPDNLDSAFNGQFQLKKGHSMYDFNIVESAGVDPNSGAELYWNNTPEGRVIDSVYANVINSGRTYLGSAIPDLMGSFHNEFRFRNFDLSILATYGIGGKFYDGVYQSLMHSGDWGKNWHQDILNAWTPENSTSSIPRVEILSQNIGQSSSRFLIDASYLNIRNVSLGYTLPAKVTERLRLSNIRVYGLVDNLYMFTQRQGMNPQGNFSGQASWDYTPARTIMIGARITL